jgi:hypothetical protein
LDIGRDGGNYFVYAQYFSVCFAFYKEVDKFSSGEVKSGSFVRFFRREIRGVGIKLVSNGVQKTFWIVARNSFFVKAHKVSY